MKKFLILIAATSVITVCACKKNKLFLLLTIITLFLAACKKSNSGGAGTNTVNGSFSLTYAGKTISFDSSYYGVGPGSGQRRIIAKNKGALLNSLQGSGTFCYFDVDSLLTGKYTRQTIQQIDVGVVFMDNSKVINPDNTLYIYVVSLKTTNRISGSFAFRVSSTNVQDSARGTFDISF